MNNRPVGACSSERQSHPIDMIIIIIKLQEMFEDIFIVYIINSYGGFQL
jgi:hypothetical protein